MKILAPEFLVEFMDSLDDPRRQIGRFLGLGFRLRLAFGFSLWLGFGFRLKLCFSLRFRICFVFGLRFSLGFRLLLDLCFYNSPQFSDSPLSSEML